MPSNRSNHKPAAEAAAGTPIHRYSFEAIGTVWAIDLYQPLDDAAYRRLGRAIRGRIGRFDRHYSRFRPDSLVSAMAAQAATYRLPADARPMLDLYRQLYDLTDGAMTPLAGQLLADAGYDADYSLTPKKPVPPPRWDDVLDYRYPELTVKRPVLLDFGAAGKGYLLDIVGRLLQKHGVGAYCIDAGGDILFRGATPEQTLRVGLEHPADSSLVIGVAALNGRSGSHGSQNGKSSRNYMSICGSAGNRRDWGQYHHIIDPRSLASPRHIAGLWTVAGQGLLADALATALFFVPPEKLEDQYHFQYAIVYDDYSLRASAGFPAEFYTNTENHAG